MGCGFKEPPPPAVFLSPDITREMKNNKNYWIEVQIPQRTLLLARGDQIIKKFPIAVGKPQFPTPIGMRFIDSVVWNPWWYPPKESSWVTDATPVRPRTPENPLGEIKMPLGKAYLIHGTSVIHSIGQWASHGCLRMLFEDMFWLVDHLMDKYASVSAVSAFEKANTHPHREFTVKLKKEIPVFLTYETIKVTNGYVTLYPDLYKMEKDRNAHLQEMLAPYLKDEQTLNNRKIKNLLKLYKDQTIHVPLEEILINS